MITYFYRIYNDNYNYIGRTGNLYNRLSQHRGKSNKGVSSIFNGNFKCEILEYCENLTYEEIKKKEGEYIIKYDCINIQTNNKYEKNDPRYYQENKEKIKLRMKEYNKNLPDNFHKQRNERTKINCECGGKYVKRNKKIHEKTKKHINYLNHNNNALEIR